MYRYDVFVSYPNLGAIPGWVSGVLVPELKERLEDELGRPCRLAFDRESIDAGQDWPDKLIEMHLHSRCFLPVLSAPYLTSGWCASEWQTARLRSRAMAGRDGNAPLVVPIRYNDPGVAWKGSDPQWSARLT